MNRVGTAMAVAMALFVSGAARAQDVQGNALKMIAIEGGGGFIEGGGGFDLEGGGYVPPPDTTAPASNPLSAYPGQIEATLEMTEPGDDGNSAAPSGATQFRVYYSQSSFDAGTFSSATEIISGVPPPTAQGNLWTMPVTGLSPETTYYMAVRSIDDVGNAAFSGVWVTTQPVAQAAVVTEIEDGIDHAAGDCSYSSSGAAMPMAFLLGSALVLILKR